MLAKIVRLYDSPVRLTAAVAGWWWVSNLLVGLLISHDFATAEPVATTVHVLFVPITVNGWHVLIHGVVGVIGLATATRRAWAVSYLAAFGPAMVLWGVAGLSGGGSVGFVMADAFGSWVHVVEGVLLMIVLVLSRWAVIPAAVEHLRKRAPAGTAAP